MQQFFFFLLVSSSFEECVDWDGMNVSMSLHINYPFCCALIRRNPELHSFVAKKEI